MELCSWGGKVEERLWLQHGKAPRLVTKVEGSPSRGHELAERQNHSPLGKGIGSVRPGSLGGTKRLYFGGVGPIEKKYGRLFFPAYDSFAKVETGG